MIGKVIAADNDTITARVLLDDIETLHMGDLVVIDSRFQYLARVSSVYSKNIGEANLPDKMAVLTDRMDEMESLFGTQFYYAAECGVLGVLDKGIKPAKTIPTFLSGIRKAKSKDLEFLLKEGKNYLKIGKLRNMALPIKINIETFITKHAGVFGKTGSGKSNTVKVIIGEMIQQRLPALIFDVHGEYGYKRGLGGMENVIVVGLPGSECDVSLTVPLQMITPSDLRVMTFLTEAQEDAVALIYKRSRGRWLEYLSESETEEIVEDFDNKIQMATILALQRKVERVVDYEFVGRAFDSLNYILQKIKRGKIIIIDFGDYEHNDWVIKLITSIISRFLLNRYKKYKKEGKKNKETLLVLEEAHKLLNKEIAKKTIFSNIVREGRKFNLGLCIVDQMPQKIFEEVLAQLNTVIIMLLTNIKDREHLVLSSENDLTGFKKEMKRLEVGEAIITGISVPFPIPAKIDLFKRTHVKKEGFDQFEFNELDI
ncbi:MAG: ATP-binding protein [Euryarchaeota archaeon]|nr:ATP-binding protein [Euryarchaeota archaeon]